MTLNQILNMVTRIVMRRAVNWGVTKATGLLTRKTPAAAPTLHDADNPVAAAQSREAVKRARQAARLTRRMMR